MTDRWHLEALEALGAARRVVPESVVWRVAASLRWAHAAGVEEAGQKLDAVDKRGSPGQALSVDAIDESASERAPGGVADRRLVVDKERHAAHALERGALEGDVAHPSWPEHHVALREAEATQAIGGLKHDGLLAAREVYDARALADAFADVVHRAWRRAIEAQKLAAEEMVGPETTCVDEDFRAYSEPGESVHEGGTDVMQIDVGQVSVPLAVATQYLEGAVTVVDECGIEVVDADGVDCDAHGVQRAEE